MVQTRSGRTPTNSGSFPAIELQPVNELEPTQPARSSHTRFNARQEPLSPSLWAREFPVSNPGDIELVDFSRASPEPAPIPPRAEMSPLPPMPVFREGSGSQQAKRPKVLPVPGLDGRNPAIPTTVQRARTISDASSDTTSEPTCRYCHGGKEGGTFCRPCRCKGGLAFVHQNCLNRWLDQGRAPTCELCHTPYRRLTVAPTVSEYIQYIISRFFQWLGPIGTVGGSFCLSAYLLASGLYLRVFSLLSGLGAGQDVDWLPTWLSFLLSSLLLMGFCTTMKEDLLYLRRRAMTRQPGLTIDRIRALNIIHYSLKPHLLASITTVAGCGVRAIMWSYSGSDHLPSGAVGGGVSGNALVHHFGGALLIHMVTATDVIVNSITKPFKGNLVVVAWLLCVLLCLPYSCSLVNDLMKELFAATVHTWTELASMWHYKIETKPMYGGSIGSMPLTLGTVVAASTVYVFVLWLSNRGNRARQEEVSRQGLALCLIPWLFLLFTTAGGYALKGAVYFFVGSDKFLSIFAPHVNFPHHCFGALTLVAVYFFSSTFMRLLRKKYATFARKHTRNVVLDYNDEIDRTVGVLRGVGSMNGIPSCPDSDISDEE